MENRLCVVLWMARSHEPPRLGLLSGNLPLAVACPASPRVSPRMPSARIRIRTPEGLPNKRLYRNTAANPRRAEIRYPMRRQRGELDGVPIRNNSKRVRGIPHIRIARSSCTACRLPIDSNFRTKSCHTNLLAPRVRPANLSPCSRCPFPETLQPSPPGLHLERQITTSSE